MHPFFALKTPLLLFPFRFFDPIRKRWVRARYVAERHQIEAGYAQWEIIGAPEIRSRGNATMFSPWAALPPLKRSAHLPPVEEPPPEKEPPEREPPDNEPPDPPVEEPPEWSPTLARFERFLVLLFLRRYVTWCVRTRRIEAAEGAKRLWQIVAAARA